MRRRRDWLLVGIVLVVGWTVFLWLVGRYVNIWAEVVLVPVGWVLGVIYGWTAAERTR